MNRFWKTLLLTGTLAVIALGGFAAWHFTQPEAATLATSSTDQRLLPATYQLVSSLEEAAGQAEAPATVYTRLGYAYVQSARETGDGQYTDAAEAAFHRALEADPQSFEAMGGLGTVLLTRHRFAEALAWGEQAVAANPRLALSYGVVVDALVELGRYDEAVAAAQQMVNLRPDIASYSRISYLRELYGDLPGAIDAMQRAVSAGSGSREHTSWSRVYLGHLYFHQGNLEAAEAAYQEALYFHPGSGPALAGMGRIYLAQQQPEEAVASYEAAAEALPIPEHTISLAGAYEAAGRTLDADALFAEAIAELEGERESGMDVDDELTSLLLQRNQNLPYALRLAEGAYDRRPTVKNASLLAWAHHHNGNPAEAKRLTEESLRLGTEEAVLYYRAGVIAATANKKGEAKKHLQRALDLNPHFSLGEAAEARRILATLN